MSTADWYLSARTNTDRIAITMRLQPKLHKRVSAQAAKRGVSVNFLVTRAVAEWLDNHEKDWK